MKQVQKLETRDDYNTFLNNQQSDSDILLLKISSQCTVSFVVQKIFELWFRAIDQESKLRCGIVDVITAREISNQIAEDFSLKHESPQALWLTPEKKVKWSGSHHRITAEALQNCLTSR